MTFVVDCWRPPPPDRLAKRDNAPPVRAIVGPFETHEAARAWREAHWREWARLSVMELQGPSGGVPKSGD